MNASARWPDERLDDLADSVRSLDSTVREIAEVTVITRERAAAAIKRSTECVKIVDDLELYLRNRDEAQAKERKTDRRWLVGTVLSSAGLIIAAVSLLAEKL